MYGCSGTVPCCNGRLSRNSLRKCADVHAHGRPASLHQGANRRHACAPAPEECRPCPRGRSGRLPGPGGRPPASATTPGSRRESRHGGSSPRLVEHLAEGQRDRFEPGEQTPILLARQRGEQAVFNRCPARTSPPVRLPSSKARRLAQERALSMVVDHDSWSTIAVLPESKRSDSALDHRITLANPRFQLRTVQAR